MKHANRKRLAAEIDAKTSLLDKQIPVQPKLTEPLLQLGNPTDDGDETTSADEDGFTKMLLKYMKQARPGLCFF